MTERVLIVGSGAREHAMADALARSPLRPEIICFGTARNPGIVALCKAYETGDIAHSHTVGAFAERERATLAIIGPEAPLAGGVADHLWWIGVPTVGPRRLLAQLESSKGFTRDLLARHRIPGNPFFRRFTNMDGVEDTLREYAGRHVIKDDGLAGGKGVKVWGDHLQTMEESLAFCWELSGKGGFIIEEKLEGQEFSLLCFSDGKTQRYMPAVQDHKRAFVGDTGPNTGGMGTYTAPGRLPFLTARDMEEAWEISESVAFALTKDFDEPYQGILYGGFMATADGVKLIEYNARFGDPEALNLLTLLRTDFLEVCQAIVRQTLARLPVAFHEQASVCKYIVPEGYPDAPRQGDEVALPRRVPRDVRMYMGAVDVRDEKIFATGSRTVGVVGVGHDLTAAERICQQTVDQIKGPFFHRRDIGTAALIDERVAHMRRLRPA